MEESGGFRFTLSSGGIIPDTFLRALYVSSGNPGFWTSNGVTPYSFPDPYKPKDDNAAPFYAVADWLEEHGWVEMANEIRRRNIGV